MYFVIQNNTIERAEKESWKESEDAIGIFSAAEWKEQVELKNDCNLNQPQSNIRFCKLESHAEYLFGTLYIPIKKNPQKNYSFAFYILEGKIIFIDDTDLVHDIIIKLSEFKVRREYSMERFLYDFLVSLIEDDLIYIESFEREISIIEEEVLEGNYDDFNYKMLGLKKEISRLYRYYSQLTNLGEELSENEIDFFGKDDIATFRIFTDRAARLQSETQVLREYSMQVQDVYRSEISIRQNDVMKVLTIVTTIFLPLTLLVGWYGMNFTKMPEIDWDYGYPLVIFISIAIIIVCLWIFKKKKFW